MARAKPCIWVLAGTNGAGKSSIAGAFLRENGGDYYNPDEAARRILEANPGLEQAEANSLAWKQGTDLLRAAILNRQDYVFETTLGGETVTRLLEEAIESGHSVRVWYIGLATPEMNNEKNQLNLIRLLPGLTELRLFDNRTPADPHTGSHPNVRLIVHYANLRVIAPKDLRGTPEWAKAMVAAALKTCTK